MSNNERDRRMAQFRAIVNAAWKSSMQDWAGCQMMEEADCLRWAENELKRLHALEEERKA